METIQHHLRTTAPERPPGGLNKRRPNPTRLFVDRDRLAWWWFICAGTVLVAAALDRYHLVNAFKQRERVVIIDPAGTFYVSPLLQFEEANELHAQQSTLRDCAHGRQREVMPIALSDVLELMNALGDLHEQADARLAGPVSVYEFTIHGILRRLRVARDLERDGVFRGCSEIVAD